ncbi:hypothetical protein HYFRA_00000175 [Hymenoscyphus fraxineus]|uniref:JmjC domain-containing protein n=1 Tax=Hymenoscyphus fraxineus TaxID=746836 RepID=A0A9N9L0E5_9HELO|nr:hypothetical protein HYFRA_00000175 [Hymenoscyphus fraxineus]
MAAMKLHLNISLDSSTVTGTIERSSAAPQSSVAEIIDTMVGFDEETINALRRMELSTLDNLPRRVKTLWDTTTTTPPRLFPAERCWVQKPPSTASLVLSTLDILGDRTQPQPTIYQRGQQAAADFDPRIAVAQLIEPDAASPVTLIGLKLPSLPDNLFKCPLGLSTSVEPYLESGHQLLLTPKLSSSDLHIDPTDGLSIPLGTCTKIWILFPPTPKNLSLLAKNEGRRSKTQRIGHLLEGGILLTTTSSSAIYLPVGCIHGVFTTSGGFLNALDFTTPDSIKTYPLLLAAGIDRKSSSFAEEVLGWFLDCVELGLDGQQEGEAVEAWVAAGERVREFGRGDGEWRRKAMVVWDDFLGRKGVRERVCGCGVEHGEGGFVEHFRVRHLWKKGAKAKAEAKEKEPEAEPVRGKGKRKREEVDAPVEVEEGELRRSKRARRPNTLRRA